jgi:UPF0755 protein
MIGKRFLIGLLVTIVILSGLGYKAYSVLHNRHLTAGLITNLKKQDITVTVIEGKRWEETAAQLAKAGVVNYQDFVTIMRSHPEYEGTLFPDTYRFFPNTPAVEVIAKLRADYTSRMALLQPTTDELTLASIVERESINDTDRPIIAGVYTNRIRVGMTMGADPTVEYSKDTIAYKAAGYSETYTFWTAITQADYHNIISPFNTYLQTGLPPYPICNPGIKSIEAAQNPLSNPYYFFGYKDGKLLLSKTLAEHQAKLR